ncbi:hypothetical protein S245_022617 [Arachis hypogaea]
MLKNFKNQFKLLDSKNTKKEEIPISLREDNCKIPTIPLLLFFPNPENERMKKKQRGEPRRQREKEKEARRALLPSLKHPSSLWLPGSSSKGAVAKLERVNEGAS